MQLIRAANGVLDYVDNQLIWSYLLFLGEKQHREVISSMFSQPTHRVEVHVQNYRTELTLTSCYFQHYHLIATALDVLPVAREDVQEAFLPGLLATLLRNLNEVRLNILLCKEDPTLTLSFS